MKGLALALVVHGAHPLRLPSRRAFARAAAATVAAPVAARAQAPPLEQPAKPPMDPSMLDVAVQLGDLRLSRPYEVRSQMLVPTCVEMARSCRIVASSSTPSTRRLLDGVVMPDPHRSTEPGRPRHRREMT